MSYDSRLLGQNATTKATYKRKCLIGFMALEASAVVAKCKRAAETAESLHFICKRYTGKGPLQVREVFSPAPNVFLPVNYYL